MARRPAHPKPFPASAKRQGRTADLLDIPVRKRTPAEQRQHKQELEKWTKNFLEPHAPALKRLGRALRNLPGRLDFDIPGPTLPTLPQLKPRSSSDKPSEEKKPMAPKDWFHNARKKHPRRQGEGPTSYARRLHPKMLEAKAELTKVWTFNGLLRRIQDK